MIPKYDVCPECQEPVHRVVYGQFESTQSWNGNGFEEVDRVEKAKEYYECTTCEWQSKEEVTGSDEVIHDES